MILRAAPLALCLFWLAYESHFSPSFFASTMEQSVASILGGMEDMLASENLVDPASQQAAEEALVLAQQDAASR
jgi:hypothetical protein